MNLSINHLFLLGIILFSVGIFAVLVRKNAIALLIGLELMLNASLLIIISFSGFHRSLDGTMLAFFMLIIAAVEAVVGLSLILLLQRLNGQIDIFKQNSLS